MPSRLLITVVLGALASIAGLTVQQPSANDLPVYIGTYTGPKSKGIYVSRLNEKSGTLAPAELAGETPSPSFLAIHPNRDFLYAVNEVDTFEGKKSGSVSAFRFDRATGKLTGLNVQPSVGGGPAHISLDSNGQYALVANYGGGSIAALPIGSDGLLKPASAFVQHTGSGKNPERQKEPHAHSIDLDAANRFAYVADLGIDKVMIYRFDAAKGTLTANEPPSATVDPGSGPRHVAMHPQGRYAYVINELTCTVTAFSRDPDKGSLTPIQTVSTLPAGQAVVAGYSTAEIQVHPSGKFLYGSNRGHDTIVVFAIDQKTGQLTLVEHQSTQGSTPRNFGIDPSGAYLVAANQRSDSVVVFRINADTGRLTPTGSKIDVGAPVCVKFVKRR